MGRIFGGKRRREASQPPEEGRSPAEGGTGSSGVAWTDSHCHLHSLDDPAGVLARAAAAGVRRVVTVGTDAASSRQAIEVATSLGGPGAGGIEAWATVGLHPHDASQGVEDLQELVDQVAGTGFAPSRVVAIGECGLDYHYDHSPRLAQRSVFAAQVALARSTGLALVVHTREAWDDTFRIFEAEGVPERTVFHCFTGGPDEAKACVALGAYLSFSGILTFGTATDLREAATAVPLDRMLVETDSPFLTPVPHRGKPNEPCYVPLVGAALAELRQVEPAEVAVATTANAAVVFDLHG